MRNLKRALSLGLSSAMVLGTMAFSASAAKMDKFIDSDEISNAKAASIVNEIGAMEGYTDGTFKPDEVVTRVQMAVICTTMLYGAGFNVAQFVDSNEFSDMVNPAGVEHWGIDYVNLAHSEGIVTGRGNGIFDPDATVSSAEAMLMILKTLGYFENRDEFQTDWVLATTKKATELKLYGVGEEEMSLPAHQGLIRDNVAAIVFTALTKCVQVDYNPSQTAYYNKDGSMQNGVDNTVIEDTLGWNSFKLKPHFDVDEFNRPSTTWMHDAKNIGTYTDAATHTYTTGVTQGEVYDAIGSAVLNNTTDYTRAFYVDGELIEDTDDVTGAGMLEFIEKNGTKSFYESGNGVLTQIFVLAPEYYDHSDDGKPYGSLKVPGEVIISQIHSYLAEVTSVIESGDINLITVKYADNIEAITYDSNSTTHWYENTNPDENEVVLETEKVFEKGDMVIVRASHANATDAYKDAVEIDYATEVTGISTASKLDPTVTGGDWLEVDGEQFDYAITMRGNIDDDGVMAPTNEDPITAYLDEYGYVIGYRAEVAEAQYLYIEDKDYGNVLAGANVRATFADGTEQIVKVTHIDGVAITNDVWLSDVPGDITMKDSTGATSSAGDNYWTKESGYTYGATQQSRVYGYEVRSDETYNLLTAIGREHVSGSNSQYAGDTNYTYNELDKTTRRAGLLGDNTTLLEGNESGSGTQVGKDGVNDLATVKDSMAIYNSNRLNITDNSTVASVSGVTLLPYKTDEISDLANTDGSIVMYDETVGESNINVVQANTNNYGYVFEIQNGVSAVFKKTTIAKSGIDAGEIDHVFFTDNQTVFVNVHSDEVWVGYNSVPSMGGDDGDLNMQVVFGKNGVADVVYINNGGPDDVAGDYFILKNPKAVWTTQNGVSTYTYTVYINGYETTIVAKDNELKDNDGNELDRTRLYKITDHDDDYVYAVDMKIDYDPYLDKYVESQAYKDLNLNTLTAANHASFGLIELLDDDNYDGNKGDPFQNESQGDDWTADEYIDGENGFSYSEDTVFVLLTGQKDGSFVVSPGSVDSIHTYTDDRFYHSVVSYVDVVAADGNKRTPEADLVVVVNPYVGADSTGGSVVTTDSVLGVAMGRKVTSAAGDTVYIDLTGGKVNVFNTGANELSAVEAATLARQAAVAAAAGGAVVSDAVLYASDGVMPNGGRGCSDGTYYWTISANKITTSYTFDLTADTSFDPSNAVVWGEDGVMYSATTAANATVIDSDLGTAYGWMTYSNGTTAMIKADSSGAKYTTGMYVTTGLIRTDLDSEALEKGMTATLKPTVTTTGTVWSETSTNTVIAGYNATASAYYAKDQVKYDVAVKVTSDFAGIAADTGKFTLTGGNTDGATGTMVSTNYTTSVDESSTHSQYPLVTGMVETSNGNLKRDTYTITDSVKDGDANGAATLVVGYTKATGVFFMLNGEADGAAEDTLLRDSAGINVKDNTYIKVGGALKFVSSGAGADLVFESAAVVSNASYETRIETISLKNNSTATAVSLTGATKKTDESYYLDNTSESQFTVTVKFTASGTSHAVAGEDALSVVHKDAAGKVVKTTELTAGNVYAATLTFDAKGAQGGVTAITIS